MRKVYWFLFCFLNFLQNLPAQDSRLYAFTHYTVKDGLASYNTQSIVQDKQGYMWIATINGLQRFDGTRFITFRHNPADPDALPDNYIYQLHIDKEQHLWVLLNNGKVGIFDTHQFIFKEVKIRVKNQRHLTAIRSLLEDSGGNLFYVIPHEEILTFSKKNNEFAAAHNPFDLPPNWSVGNVVEDSVAKKYWIATDSGMAVFNKVTRQLSYRGHNTEKEPFIEQFGNITGLSNYGVDAQRRLWFLSWPYTRDWGLIYCYDLNKEKAVFKDYNLVPLVKGYFEPSCILQQKDGSIWIAGLNIFIKYNALQKNFQQVYNGYVNDQGISYESVKCLFEDSEQNIWVATDNNGLYVFNPSKQFFSSIKHINRNSQKAGRGALMSFALTHSGQLLTGTWGDGLYQYDSNLNAVPFNIKGMDSLCKYSIWDMHTLRDKKTIWMVGQPSVVMLYDQPTQSVKKYNPKIFGGRTIRQVAEDQQGNIWLGMHSSGVYKWTPGAGTKNFEDGFYKVNSIPDIKIQGITADSKGFIWICTATEGIYKINPANDSIVEHITSNGTPAKRLLNNDAITALEYNDSIMILLTGALNIYNTHTHTISYITALNGLPSESATSIQKDMDGYLWISFLNGLCRMNLEKKTFTYYDRHDGIANDNFDIASHYLPDGRMLFGTTNDFLVFNPDDIQTNLPPRNVTITGFKLFNKPLSVDSLLQHGGIELQSSQNYISISFSSLSYFNRNKLSYYYKLENIDKEWKKASEVNEAVYNYLPPGAYTFKVISENADGVLSAKATEFKIIVHSPFWQTWLFYCILALLAGCIIYWLDKERMKRKESMQQMRSDIADNLHEEVNTALNNINILSEIAKLKASKEPVKSIEYLEQIHTKSHNMIIAMDDMLWGIDPENDSMRKTVERMKEYTDALKNRHSTQIDILVDKKVERLELNMKHRLESFLLFKEVINTIVQGGAQNNRIHIGLEKTNIICTIQFDNNGSDMQQLGSALQRPDLDKRLKEINARLKMQLDKSHSVVILKIPANL